MVFHHQSDVSLSLSYCMVGSSNTNLLCFLFWDRSNTSIFNAHDDGIFKVMYLYLSRIAWLDRLTALVFVYRFDGGFVYISGGQTRLTSCTISVAIVFCCKMIAGSIFNARDDGISPSK